MRNSIFFKIIIIIMYNYAKYIEFRKKHLYNSKKSKKHYEACYCGKIPKIITCFKNEISHIDFELYKISDKKFIGISFKPLPLIIYRTDANLWFELDSYYPIIIFAKTYIGIKPIHLVKINFKRKL